MFYPLYYDEWSILKTFSFTGLPVFHETSLNPYIIQELFTIDLNNGGKNK